MPLDLFTMLLLAVGLAMDSLAVAIALGATIQRLRTAQVLRLALAFGGFQGLMPIIGYLAASSLRENVWVAALDHWIAFGLLAGMGGKMISEARFLKDEAQAPANAAVDPTKGATLMLLAIATSIDALAVGASLAFLRVRILLPSAIIGLTAAVFAVAGAYLGRHYGQRFGKRVEIFGGLMLIAIGLRILIDHLMHPTPAELGRLGLALIT